MERPLLRTYYPLSLFHSDDDDLHLHLLLLDPISSLSAVVDGKSVCIQIGVCSAVFIVSFSQRFCGLFLTLLRAPSLVGFTNFPFGHLPHHPIRQPQQHCTVCLYLLVSHRRMREGESRRAPE